MTFQKFARYSAVLIRYSYSLNAVIVYSSLLSVTNRAFVQSQQVVVLASADLLEHIPAAERALDIVGKCHLDGMGTVGVKPVFRGSRSRQFDLLTVSG